MKKTILTLAMMLAGILSTQAQDIPTLVLDDTQDLVPIINAAAEAGGTYDITFSDRKINLDDRTTGWNVWCLPFDISPAGFRDILGSYVIDMLIKENNDGNIHFEPTVSGKIPAGTPFIVKVGKMKRTPTNFKRLTFEGVTLKKIEAQHIEEDACGNRFISTFTPIELYGKHIWYMTKGTWYDARNFSEEQPVRLKPLRAYIDFSQNTVTEAPMIIIDEPDGTTTVIDPATFNKGEFKSNASQDDGWYTVTGMRLTDEPTAKGVYIHNARKVVIK